MPPKIYRNHHIDSERWARYSPRDDDIVIATPIKSGTTWTQGIIANMLFPEGLPGKVWELSPWFENRRVSESDMFQKLESQTHRRFIKSHVAADSIPIHANVRFVSVGRDGRDLIMSLYNHYSTYSEQMLGGLQQRARADGEEFPSAPDTLEEFWQNWCTRGWFEDQHDGWPFWSDLHIMQTWWELREEPNVLLLRYADMLADPGAEISRLARFLDIELSDKRHCFRQKIAAVPEEAVPKTLLRRGRIRLFDETVNEHHPRNADRRRGRCDVAVAGIGMRRLNAEGDDVSLLSGAQSIVDGG